MLVLFAVFFRYQEEAKTGYELIVSGSEVPGFRGSEVQDGKEFGMDRREFLASSVDGRVGHHGIR